MDLEETARRLLKAVNAEETEVSIRGVISVFQSFKDVIDVNWEEWITKNSNAILAIDNFRCECGKRIQIERTRHYVTQNEI